MMRTEPVPVPGLDTDEQRQLVRVAEEAIRTQLERRRPALVSLDDVPGPLASPGASFVTLRQGEALLGCIGTMTPVRPLVHDVAGNALNAAFADPRLPALTADQFVTMTLKVSVLSAMQQLPVQSIEDLAGTVEANLDGLLIEAGRHRGTFLPSVWQQVRSTHEFLSLLWQKAGMRPGTWPDEMTVYRYRTLEFGDDGPRAPIRPA